MTAIDKLKEVSAFLESKGIEDAAKEAEILITETLHIDKSKLYAGGLRISDETSGYIDSLAARRAEGEPLQYITGYVEFYGLKINVGRGILIPRPETELLVEESINELKKRFTVHNSRFTVLDLCTGSGCIAIAIARCFPAADVYGVDKSDVAIEYATRNAIENNVRNVHFIKGDLFESLGSLMFDFIVSNPPYIKHNDIKNLQREVRDYEPLSALDGGEDGLDFYRRISAGAPQFLKENGIIILEIGYDQAESVREIAIGAEMKDVIFIRDYAGIRRILSVAM